MNKKLLLAGLLVAMSTGVMAQNELAIKTHGKVIDELAKVTFENMQYAKAKIDKNVDAINKNRMFINDSFDMATKIANGVIDNKAGVAEVKKAISEEAEQREHAVDTLGTGLINNGKAIDKNAEGISKNSKDIGANSKAILGIWTEQGKQNKEIDKNKKYQDGVNKKIVKRLAEKADVVDLGNEIRDRKEADKKIVEAQDKMNKAFAEADVYLANKAAENKVAIDKNKKYQDGVNKKIVKRLAEKADVVDLGNEIRDRKEADKKIVEAQDKMNKAFAEADVYLANKAAENKVTIDKNKKHQDSMNKAFAEADVYLANKIADNKDKTVKNEKAIAENKRDISDTVDAVISVAGHVDKNREAIAENKTAVAKNEKAIVEESKVRRTEVKNLMAADDELGRRINENEEQIKHVNAQVEHLDSKLNQGMSLMAAMSSVDFGELQEGDLAIGAGIGHFGNAQGVAVGVAYEPVQDMHINAKYSVSTKDVKTSAIGVGVTYKMNLNK